MPFSIDLRRVATAVFFLALIGTGLTVHRDSGIFFDEFMCRRSGHLALMDRIADLPALEAERAAAGHFHEIIGPAYEMLLALLEKAFALSDLRDIFFFRHAANFLTFAGAVAVFHRLALRRFGGSWLPLLGCLFFTLTPRFFTHAFVNTKDIGFMAFFSLGAWTLMRFLDRPTAARAALHGAALSFVVSIRSLGVFLYLVTALFAAAECLRVSGPERAQKAHAMLRSAAAGGAVSLVLLPVFWPLLRVDPGHFWFIWRTMAEQPLLIFSRPSFYLGRFYPPDGLPWHYLPVWMLITIPPAYTFLFLGGALASWAAFLRRPLDFLRTRRDDLVVLVWFFVPLILSMALRPVDYDEWRHYLFLYPAFLYLALLGARAVDSGWRQARPAAAYRRLRAAAVAVLLAGLLPVAYFMVSRHPYQNLYFNRAAGASLAEISRRFEMDYAGLSYRRALEFLVQYDRSDIIPMGMDHFPGVASAVLLEKKDRERLRFFETVPNPRYFAGNFRWADKGYPYPPWQEIYSVKVDGVKIMVLYDLWLRQRPQGGSA